MRLLLTTAIIPAYALRGKDAITKAVQNSNNGGANIDKQIGATLSNKGKECTFLNSFNEFVDRAADAGILNCDIGKTCVEDSTSSMGGRCVEILDEAAYEEAYYEFGLQTNQESGLRISRKLATCTFANGTAGQKCSGVMACVGQTYSEVACGSCNGKKSCKGLYKAVIEEGSCIGDMGKKLLQCLQDACTMSFVASIF
jgi:hypothetical protein